MLSGGKDQIACTVATSVKVTGLKATALSKGRIQLKWTGYPTNYKNGYSRYVIEYKTSAKGAYKRLKLSGDSNGSYTPVSYTHLDVYKRQHIYSGLQTYSP